jgi:molybdopterin converting factor subunit 1
MIKIKFFAMLRSLVTDGEAEMEVGEAATVRDLIAKLEADYPGIGRALEDAKAKTAVNHEFVGRGAPINDGDEVAFIPPMSGGSCADPELVRLQPEDFSVDEEIARVLKSSTSIGGIDVFLGTARERSRDRTITGLEFEHYPEMAEKQLRRTRDEALKRFDIIEVAIVHRYGTIGIGEKIVLVVVAAQHREDAFAACCWCIDELKQTAPIWKKEITAEGDFWVEEHP